MYCTAVLDAGHMVPMDQPRIALDMISSFLQNKPFGKVVSKLAVSLSGSEDATISRCPRFPSDDASATSGSSSAGASSAAPSTGLGGIMNSLWPSSSAGAGGGGTASSEKKMRGGPRKGRGRRGFAVSTPQAQVSDSSLGQQRDRQLLEESSSPPFTLSIGHATPLNGSVLLHLRLTQTGAAYHQHQALHEGASNALLSQQHFEIRVDPGQREVLVDVVELARRKFSTDIVIDNLRDGTEYAFSTWWQDGRGNKQLMSKRSVLVKPGCFHPSMIQCCGRGECVPSSSGGEDHGGGVSSGDTYCKCDSGYTGPLCSSYAVSTTGVSNAAKQITDAGVSCPAHTLHHAHILNSTSFHGKKKMSLESSSDATKYCQRSISVGGGGGCCVSVGLLLQPRGSQSWAAPSMFQTKYRDIVSAALQQDIIGIISLGTTGGSTRVSVESSTGAPLQVLPGETAVVNRSSHSSSSPSSVGHHSVHTHAHHVHPSSKEAVAAADAHSHTVHVSIKLCGLNTEVDAEVRRLLQQLTDSSSALRSGLVSSHLKANYVVVVAHTASSTASSPTTARSIGAAPGDVDGDTGDEKSSYIWFSFLGLLIVSCAFGVKGIWHASSRR